MNARNLAVAAAVAAVVGLGASQAQATALNCSSILHTCVASFADTVLQTTELTGLGGATPDVLAIPQANANFFAGYTLSGISIVFSGILQNSGTLFLPVGTTGSLTGFGISTSTFTFSAANPFLNAALSAVSGNTFVLNTNTVTVTNQTGLPISGGPADFNANALTVNSGLFALFEGSGNVNIGASTSTSDSSHTIGGGGALGLIMTTTAGADYTIAYTYTPNTTKVPEPLSALVLGSGLVGLGMLRRRHNKQV